MQLARQQASDVTVAAEAKMRELRVAHKAQLLDSKAQHEAAIEEIRRQTSERNTASETELRGRLDLLTSAHEVAIDGAHHENAELTDRDKQLESELNQMDEKIETMQGEMSQANNKIGELEPDLQKKSEDLDAVLTDVENKTNELAMAHQAAKRENNEFTGKISDLILDLDTVRRKNTALESDFTEKSHELVKAQEMIRQKTHDFDIARREKAELAGTVDELRSRIEEESRGRKLLETTIGEKDGQVALLTIENGSLKHKVERLEQQVSDNAITAQYSINDLTALFKSLEAKYVQLQTSKDAKLLQKDGEIEELTKDREAKVTEKDRKIANLEDLVKSATKSHEAEIRELKKQLRDREEQVAQYHKKKPYNVLDSSLSKNNSNDDDDSNDGHDGAGHGSCIKKDAPTSSDDRDQPDGSQQHERSDGQHERPSGSSSSTSDAQEAGDDIGESSVDLITVTTEAQTDDAEDEVGTGAGSSESIVTTPQDVGDSDEPFSITDKPAVEAFSNVQYTKRGKRKDMGDQFHIRSRYRVYHDDKLTVLSLPYCDDYYHGLQIPHPVQDPNVPQKDGKMAKQCYHCHEWYDTIGFNNHLPVCREFFKTAVFCDGCHKVYSNNAAYKQQHVPVCNPPPEVQQPPQQVESTSMVVVDRPSHDESHTPQSPSDTSEGGTPCTYCNHKFQDLKSHMKTCLFLRLKLDRSRCSFCGNIPEGDRTHHYCTCRQNAKRESSSPVGRNKNNGYSSPSQPPHTPQYGSPALAYQPAYGMMSSNTMQTPPNGYGSPFPHTPSPYHMMQGGIPLAYAGWDTHSPTFPPHAGSWD
jgi:predicted  nucleic acid-binding Zn-ribbon protein